MGTSVTMMDRLKVLYTGGNDVLKEKEINVFYTREEGNTTISFLNGMDEMITFSYNDLKKMLEV